MVAPKLLLIGAVAGALLGFASAGPTAQAATVHGELVEIHGHRVDGTEVAEGFAVRDGATMRRVSAGQPEALIGQDVTVTDDDPAEPGVQGDARPRSEQTVVAAPGPGPQTALVIVLTTPDSQQPLASDAAAQQVVFGPGASASELFKTQSGGTTYLTGRSFSSGDVTDIAVSHDVSGCDYDAIAGQARAAADTRGWNTAAYDHLIYVLPPNSSCNWAGLAYMPGHDVWISNYLQWNVVSHELGHNLGANHANALRCYDSSYNLVAFSENCTSDEYGDPFDTMGVTEAEMGVWHRFQVGQLANDDVRTLTAATSVKIGSAEWPSGGIQTVLVPIKHAHAPVTNWFSIDQRGADPTYDHWSNGDPVTTGLTIRKVPAATVAEQTQLIDTNPQTSTFDDAALQPGQTFTDPEDNIAITAQYGGDGALIASVAMPTLTDDVAPSPPSFLNVGGDTQAIRLSWGPSTDDTKVDHYEISRDATLLGSSPDTSFVDDHTTSLVQATYSVVAVDTSGNRSDAVSRRITVADATPPTDVGRVDANVDGGKVLLTWTAAADNRGVTGYEIRRDDGSTARTGQLRYTDSPAPGTRSWQVRAYDAAGNLSAPRSVDATIENPPQPPDDTDSPPAGPTDPHSNDTTDDREPSGQGTPGATGGAGSAPHNGGSPSPAAQPGPSAPWSTWPFTTAIQDHPDETDDSFFATSVDDAEIELVTARHTRATRFHRARWTMEFEADGAESMRVTANGRTLASSDDDTIEAAVAMPRHGTRTIAVSASFTDGQLVQRRRLR